MHIYQYAADNLITDIPQGCMNRLVSVLPEGSKYTCNHDFKFKDEPRYDSDVYRIKMLKDNPDGVWIDWDVWVKQWPTFIHNDKPYCTVQADVMYANGCVGFFKSLWDEFNQKDQKPYWLQDMLRRYKSDWYTIPTGYFVHTLNYGYTKLTGKWSSYGNKEFTVKRDGKLTIAE